MDKQNSFYTISLNSSIDYSFYLSADIVYDDINRIKESRIDAGGKGLNVARMLTELGCSCTALTFIGGETGEKLKLLLESEGVQYLYVNTKGSVRNVYNFFSKGRVLRFNETGSHISCTEKKNFFALFDNIHFRTGDILLISGSLPPGVEKDIYRKIIEAGKKKGLYTVLDTDGEALSEGIKALPDVIKPNIWEIERIAGQRISSSSVLSEVLEDLVKKGISTVALTLGDKGALFFSREYLLYASVPQVKVESTVGCGDAFIGGFLYGLYKKKSACECLKWAAASGTAKATMKGTLMPGKKEIRKIIEKVKVSNVHIDELSPVFNNRK